MSYESFVNIYRLFMIFIEKTRGHSQDFKVIIFKHLDILLLSESATTFRNFAIRKKTIRQKRISKLLQFGKTYRQKIHYSEIGINLFEIRTISNLYSAKVNNEKILITKLTIRQNTLLLWSYNLCTPFKHDSRCALFSLLSFVTTNSTPQREAQRMSCLKGVQRL